MRIDPSDLLQTARAVMLAAGVDAAQTGSVSDNLIWCDMAGRRNYGVSRLPIMLKRVALGVIRCPCEPHFESHSPSVATLHADNGFGHYASQLALDRACDLAEEFGVGVVGVTDSNFFGAGAYYVARAAQRGMISLALSNSVPQVTAPGGVRAVLGTNPMAFGAPRRDGRALLLDMSTAAMASSTVREKLRTEGVLAEGIAIDPQGEPLVSAENQTTFTLLPAAGAKGFGLSIMIEILSSVLTGAGMSHQIASMYRDFNEGGHNGHFFLALDVKKWMPMKEYFDRFEVLAGMLAHSSPDGQSRLPGAERWRQIAQSQEIGIGLAPDIREEFEGLARQHGVPIPWSRS